nr:hypothetical protein MFMH1_41210 [Myxococcus sp. MH1]
MSDWSNRPHVVGATVHFPEALERVERQADDEIRHGRPFTRRNILRTTGGILIATVLPIYTTGCCTEDEAECPADLQKYLILIAKAVQIVSQVIQGDLKLSDKNDRCRVYEFALDLFKQSDISTGVAVSQGILEIESCPGKESIRPLEEARLLSQKTGIHLIQTTFAGGKVTSNDFDIRG